MKNITKIAAVMVCVLVFATTVSCDFSDSGNVFSSVANGEDLPAEFAIASGDPYLILECFAATY
jgi:hypothetical protein